jgi:hypothetical protein
MENGFQHGGMKEMTNVEIRMTKEIRSTNVEASVLIRP